MVSVTNKKQDPTVPIVSVTKNLDPTVPMVFVTKNQDPTTCASVYCPVGVSVHCEYCGTKKTAPNSE